MRTSLLIATLFAFSGQFCLAASSDLTRRGFILGSTASVVTFALAPSIQLKPIEVAMSEVEALKALDQMCEGFLRLATRNWMEFLKFHTDPSTGFIRLPNWKPAEIQSEAGIKLSAEVRPVDLKIFQKLQIAVADLIHPTTKQIESVIQSLAPPQEPSADKSPNELVYVVVPHLVEK